MDNSERRNRELIILPRYFVPSKPFIERQFINRSLPQWQQTLKIITANHPYKLKGIPMKICWTLSFLNSKRKRQQKLWGSNRMRNLTIFYTLTYLIIRIIRNNKLANFILYAKILTPRKMVFINNDTVENSDARIMARRYWLGPTNETFSLRNIFPVRKQSERNFANSNRTLGKLFP